MTTGASSPTLLFLPLPPKIEVLLLLRINESSNFRKQVVFPNSNSAVAQLYCRNKINNRKYSVSIVVNIMIAVRPKGSWWCQPFIYSGQQLVNHRQPIPSQHFSAPSVSNMGKVVGLPARTLHSTPVLSTP